MSSGVGIAGNPGNQPGCGDSGGTVGGIYLSCGSLKGCHAELVEVGHPVALSFGKLRTGYQLRVTGLCENLPGFWKVS